MRICDSRLLDPDFIEIPFPNITGVEFRYVVDSDQLYCVSDQGRVYSRLGGRGIIKNEWRELNRQKGRDIYWFVTIQKRGKAHPRKVHQIVLDAFVGLCPDGMEARHADDDRLNPVLSNLSWGTRSDNALDRSRNDKVIGETHGRAKLTEESVRRARELKQQGLTYEKIKVQLKEEFGVTAHLSVICHAILGRTWKHLK